MRFATIFFCLGMPAFADSPVVENVTADKSAYSWRFSVTLSHADTGWDDYADGWRVELANGTILGTRILHHPHVNEQPFTRSQSGIVVPDNTKQVFIRTKDNVGGWAEGKTAYELPD